MKGFTIICNRCGRKIVLDKDDETFYEWNVVSNKEDILIGNIGMSNMNEIYCRCGNSVSEDTGTPR